MADRVTSDDKKASVSIPSFSNTAAVPTIPVVPDKSTDLRVNAETLTAGPLSTFPDEHCGSVPRKIR